VRNFFIVQVAKELNLVFPTPSATAITIRSLHTKAEGATDARRKTKALSLSLIIAVTQRILSPFALGLIWVCESALTRFEANPVRIGISFLGCIIGASKVVSYWRWRAGDGS